MTKKPYSISILILMMVCGLARASELHVVSIYQSLDDHAGNGSRQRGTVQVNVNTPGYVTLLLSSYEPTSWNVQVGPQSIVSRVILNGYYVQTVNIRQRSLGRGGRPLVQSYYFDNERPNSRPRPLIPDQDTAFNGSYAQFDVSDPWAASLIDAAQRITRSRVTSFSTARQQNEFNLSYSPPNVGPRGVLENAETVAFGFIIGTGFAPTWDFPLIPIGRTFQNFEIELIDAARRQSRAFAGGSGARPVFLEQSDLGTTIRFRVRTVYAEQDAAGNFHTGPWSAFTQLRIPRDLNLR